MALIVNLSRAASNPIKSYFYDVPEGAIDFEISMAFIDRRTSNNYKDYLIPRITLPLEVGGGSRWNRYADLIRTSAGENLVTDEDITDVSQVEPAHVYGLNTLTFKFQNATYEVFKRKACCHCNC